MNRMIVMSKKVRVPERQRVVKTVKPDKVRKLVTPRKRN